MVIDIALIQDIVIVGISLWCILRISRHSIFNPSLWYIALHFYTVTFRLLTLNLGAATSPIIGVHSDMELYRAATASDVGLIAVALVTAVLTLKRQERECSKALNTLSNKLNIKVGKIISILCLTIGTYALFNYSYAGAALNVSGVLDTGSVDIGNFANTSYPLMAAGFAVQGALIQFVLKGFTIWRNILFAILVIATALSLTRTSFVLAVVLAFLIYQAIEQRESIPFRWAICLIFLSMLWFVFKPVQLAILEGENVSSLWQTAGYYFDQSITNNSSLDLQFLDMQATYMAASDESDVRFYGSTILPLLYLPIPRFMWPAKPRQNDYEYVLTSSRRPIAIVGMTPELSGESYINYGWIGCFVIPFLYMAGMQSLYKKIMIDQHLSALHLIYIVLLVSMVQVYRDGLDSLIIYPIVVYFPLLSWGIISILLPVIKKNAKSLDEHYIVHAISR